MAELHQDPDKTDSQKSGEGNTKTKPTVWSLTPKGTRMLRIPDPDSAGNDTVEYVELSEAQVVAEGFLTKKR